MSGRAGGGVISESTLAAATMDHTHRRIANEETGRDAEEGKKQVDRKKRNEREREGEAVGGERWKETKPSFARSLRRPFDRSLRASTLPSFLRFFLSFFFLVDRFSIVSSKRELTIMHSLHGRPLRFMSLSPRQCVD